MKKKRNRTLKWIVVGCLCAFILKKDSKDA